MLTIRTSLKNNNSKRVSYRKTITASLISLKNTTTNNRMSPNSDKLKAMRRFRGKIPKASICNLPTQTRLKPLSNKKSFTLP